MSVDEAYNFRAVSERLATAGVLGPGQLAKLGAEGYEAVINLLHCAANYRVTAFYAIYAVQHLGWSRDQAYDFIADTWNLADYPVWDAFVAEMLKP